MGVIGNSTADGPPEHPRAPANSGGEEPAPHRTTSPPELKAILLVAKKYGSGVAAKKFKVDQQCVEDWMKGNWGVWIKKL